jgi:hemolysin D
MQQDAISRDKPQNKSSESTPGFTTTTASFKGQELVYAARSSLDRT